MQNGFQSRQRVLLPDKKAKIPAKKQDLFSGAGIKPQPNDSLEIKNTTLASFSKDVGVFGTLLSVEKDVKDVKDFWATTEMFFKNLWRMFYKKQYNSLLKASPFERQSLAVNFIE